MSSAKKKQRRTPQNTGPKNPLTVLGYLNFSNGEANADFRRQLNQATFKLGSDWKPETIRLWLEKSLKSARQSAAGFADATQAAQVIRLVFEECLPAYRAHHADLLFHLDESEFYQPFFLTSVFEAVLQQGGPWSETERITAGVLDHLNDFLGYRPVAVLANGRQMQPYAHERFRPVPLYFQEVGAACGRYQALIERTIQFFQETPLEIQHQSHFDWTRMQELAVDVRAHDHLHPANKRTNYMFGEWDPHSVNTKGYYDRFVIRQIILDALLNWMEDTHRKHKKLDESEILFDASAVLCGTMLMASSISGSGPGIHDSSITLTSLLPRVAHQRDAFYARLLGEATGERKRRLLKQTEQTQQPFGHVRQRLNIELAKYGAKQVQTRHLAQMFARMGYPEASRRQAQVIPCASARIECEIHWRITNVQREIERGHLESAVDRVREIEDYLHRGIACGAIIDPWNLLGFQGQFPLFTSREDALHDMRAVELIETMERIFSVYSQTLSEAAAQGNETVQEELTQRFETLAGWWDKFASTAVMDLPEVSGQDSVDSARHVAETLSDWQKAGAAAGDVSFWKTHIDRFQSSKAYALVVDALLERGDQIASMALLMQWLNQAEFVGLDSGPYSIFSRLTKWMRLTLSDAPTGSKESAENLRKTLCRMFAFLEANAGEFWQVPTLSAATGLTNTTKEEAAPPSQEASFDEDMTEELDDDDEEELFAAAYDNMVFRDSANDGQQSDTVDEGGSRRGEETSFEIIGRFLEPRLQLIETTAELWQMAAAGLAPHLAKAQNSPSEQPTQSLAEFQTQVEGWLHTVRRWQYDLRQLRKSIYKRPISQPSGDHDSNVEYDEQLQTKNYLLHVIISTDINCETAERTLESCNLTPSAFGLDQPLKKPGSTSCAAADTPGFQTIVEIYRGVHTGNTSFVKRKLPALLECLIKQPLLYVPLNNDGDPEKVRAAQSLQSLIRFLLTELPRLGLLKETWEVLSTAFRMERRSRPGGQAVTEFDQLFRIALRNSLDCVIRSSTHWQFSRAASPRKNKNCKCGTSRSSKRPCPKTASSRNACCQRRPAVASDLTFINTTSRRPEERKTVLIKMVSEIVGRYSQLWVQHSRTTRLSTVENLSDSSLWKEVKQFILQYGSELFHARMLTLGNLRAILHNGVDRFLYYLSEQDDPLHPMPLLEDIETGEIDSGQVVEYLELIYGSVVDRMDRFVEYNTTTTQSDYGERFYCFLDFLRAEAAYERDAWNLLPFSIAHEQLSLRSQLNAACLWERVFRERNSSRAESHLKRLKRLEKQHGMHLPALTDRIEERFVKPFAVNRMLALVPPSISDARLDLPQSKVFEALEAEIQDYLNTTSGSGIDVAPWLRTLEKEVDHATSQPTSSPLTPEHASSPTSMALSLRTMQRQLRQWSQEADRNQALS